MPLASDECLPSPGHIWSEIKIGKEMLGDAIEVDGEAALFSFQAGAIRPSHAHSLSN